MSFRTQLCAGNPDHAQREMRPSPLRLEFRGGAMTDFLWTSYSEPVVTEEVVSAFKRAAITGCDFLPVQLENTMGDRVVSDLFELRPTGWGGLAASASGVRVLEECPYCKRRVFSGYTDAGQLFNADAWDRSDVFTIWPLPRYIFVTETVRDLLAKNQFSGVKPVSIDRLPKAIAGTLTPGNVRDWFHEAQAEELEAEIDAALCV